MSTIKKELESTEPIPSKAPLGSFNNPLPSFKKILTSIILIVFAIFLIWILNLNPFYTVDQTETAVVKTFGSFSKVTDAGLHLKVPFIQRVQKYHTGIETTNFVIDWDSYSSTAKQYAPLSVLSSDGLEVVIDLSVQSVLQKDKIEAIGRSFSGSDELENWKVAATRGSVRDILAQYQAEVLYGEKRGEVEQLVEDKITERLGEYFAVNAVYIRGVFLPQNLKTAIEEKMQAQQKAMQMEYVVQKEKLEADRKSIEAKGIADYTKTISYSITPSYLQWYYVQAMDKMANSPNSKIIVLPVGSSNIPGVGSTAQSPSVILNTG